MLIVTGWVQFLNAEHCKGPVHSDNVKNEENGIRWTHGLLRQVDNVNMPGSEETIRETVSSDIKPPTSNESFYLI
jgi:hypothetical protein